MAENVLAAAKLNTTSLKSITSLMMGLPIVLNMEQGEKVKLDRIGMLGL